MKISRQWLQTFFEAPLPDAHALADALTFHAFEIESVEGDILDVKVTPNRGHDCLSHRGIAKEISAILDVPVKNDPLRALPALEPRTDAVRISIADPRLCPRYIAGYIEGVKVGPSPEWLKGSLEAIGERSINNVVDATNFVMFNLGQPLHAFDAGELAQKDGKYSIAVRLARGRPTAEGEARTGEKITILGGAEYTCTDSTLLIADANADSAVGIAGVKGGKAAEVNEQTANIIVESANFDGISVRRTASALKLRTDASSRFEQVISPELAAYGMRAVANLIIAVAGGTIVGFADEYPEPWRIRNVRVSAEQATRILGTRITPLNVGDTLRRLDLPFEDEGSDFTVTPPFERLDLSAPEDLVEEIGRIIGYDKISAVELPALDPVHGTPEINGNFFAAERAREQLIAQGYSEVYTSVFRDTGERAVANKAGGDRPFLRDSLIPGLTEALEKNTYNKDLLGFKEIKLFEIGTVWRKGKEQIVLGEADGAGVREAALQAATDVIAYADAPLSKTRRYRPFSKYPFVVRDIALWVPAGTDAETVLRSVRTAGGDLLVRSALFDRFEKDGRISLAFRLVFQSFEETLTDAEVKAVMDSVYEAVKSKGWEVR